MNVNNPTLVKGYTLFCIAFIVFLSILLNSFTHTISWDTLGYYWYLPQHFIYNQPLTDLGTIESLRTKYNLCDNLYQFNKEANGIYVIRYTLGQAIFMFPFFVFGHLSALILNFPRDGFSTPYLFWQTIGSVVYLLSSFYLLLKIVEKRIGYQLSSLTVFLLFFGTNLLFTYTDTIWRCNTHHYLFFGFVLLIYLFDKLTVNNNQYIFYLIGFISSLVLFTRPTSVFLLLPVVFLPFLNKKIKPIKYYVNILIAGLPIALLQIIYWKLNSGKWFYIGYQNPNEGFDWIGQHLIKNLFYFRKGWIIYSPIVITAFIGIYAYLKKEKKVALVFFISLLLNLLIVSSWSVWWWSQSYGHRAMIESYAYWIIPMGYGIRLLLSKPYKWFIYSILFVFCLLNSFKIWQYHSGILPPDRTTAPYYFSTFFDLKPNIKKQQLLSFNFNESPYTALITKKEIYKKIPLNSVQRLEVTHTQPFPFSYTIALNKITQSNHAIIGLTYKQFITKTTNFSPTITFAIKHNGTEYGRTYFKLTNFKPNEPILYQHPEPRSMYDTLIVYFWINEEGYGIINNIQTFALIEDEHK